MQGWIKMHRKITDWEWYKNTNTKSLFLHLLIRANHKPGRWQGHEVSKGQLFIGRKTLSSETGLSEQKIRTALSNLQNTGEITIKSTSKFSIITICNYCKYHAEFIDDNQQSNQQSTSGSTSEQPASNQQVTTNKNGNNSKNANNSKKRESRFAPPSLSEVQEYSKVQGYSIDAEQFINFYESKGWMVGKNKMKSWQAAVRTWAKRDNNKPAAPQRETAQEAQKRRALETLRSFHE